ncbi:glucan synthase [Trifolium repens]|nr:glucan synthase [Trifolium repens]KAK2373484.1 glucan synthase [Trifolium repens]
MSLFIIPPRMPTFILMDSQSPLLPDPFIPLFPIINRLCPAESDRVEKKRRTQPSQRHEPNCVSYQHICHVTLIKFPEHVINNQ